MRKLVTWVVVALGIAALLHRRKRRKASAALPEASNPAADPADELRRKLAESRAEASGVHAGVPEASVSERRAGVHDEARTALDEMRSRAEP